MDEPAGKPEVPDTKKLCIGAVVTAIVLISAVLGGMAFIPVAPMVM